MVFGHGVDHAVELGVGLRRRRTGHRPSAASTCPDPHEACGVRHQVRGVVRSTVLPGRSGHGGADGGHQTDVGFGSGDLDPGQAAGGQATGKDASQPAPSSLLVASTLRISRARRRSLRSRQARGPRPPGRLADLQQRVCGHEHEGRRRAGESENLRRGCRRVTGARRWRRPRALIADECA